MEGPEMLSKLSRANCLAESLYKSISNWHKSLIHCSTSRTNSRSVKGRDNSFVENYANPKAAEVLKKKKAKTFFLRRETVTACLARNMFSQICSPGVTQRPSPELNVLFSL